MKIMCSLPFQTCLAGETFMYNIIQDKREPHWGSFEGEISQGRNQGSLHQRGEASGQEKSCDSCVPHYRKCFVYMIIFYSFNGNDSKYSYSQF